MADKKISALNASTTPLAGTEVLPIVQGGATVKVAVSDLTAGRAISAAQATLTTGNLIVGTAGRGIDFSANGGDVLSQYDEGTFTPAWGGSGGDPTCSYSGQTGRYTRVGNIVYCWVEIVTSAKSGGSGNLQIKGLPFAARDAELNAGFASGFSLNFPSGCFANSTTTVTMTNTVPGVEQAYLGIGTLGASSYLACTIMYRIA